MYCNFTDTNSIKLSGALEVLFDPQMNFGVYFGTEQGLYALALISYSVLAVWVKFETACLMK